MSGPKKVVPILYDREDTKIEADGIPEIVQPEGVDGWQTMVKWNDREYIYDPLLTKQNDNTPSYREI